MITLVLLSCASCKGSSPKRKFSMQSFQPRRRSLQSVGTKDERKPITSLLQLDHTFKAILIFQATWATGTRAILTGGLHDAQAGAAIHISSWAPWNSRGSALDGSRGDWCWCRDWHGGPWAPLASGFWHAKTCAAVLVARRASRHRRWSALDGTGCGHWGWAWGWQGWGGCRGTRTPSAGGLRNAQTGAAVHIAGWAARDGGWSALDGCWCWCRGGTGRTGRGISTWAPLARREGHTQAGAAIDIACRATDYHRWSAVDVSKRWSRRSRQGRARMHWRGGISSWAPLAGSIWNTKARATVNVTGRAVRHCGGSRHDLRGGPRGAGPATRPTGPTGPSAGAVLTRGLRDAKAGAAIHIACWAVWHRRRLGDDLSLVGWVGPCSRAQDTCLLRYAEAGAAVHIACWAERHPGGPRHDTGASSAGSGDQCCGGGAGGCGGHCSCGGDRCGRRGCHGGCHGGRSRGGRSGRFIAAELAGGFRHTAATAAVHVAGGAQRHLGGLRDGHRAGAVATGQSSWTPAAATLWHTKAGSTVDVALRTPGDGGRPRAGVRQRHRQYLHR